MATKQGCRNREALPHALAEVIQRLVFSRTQANKGEEALDFRLGCSPHFAQLAQGFVHRGSALPTNLFWHVADPLAKVVHRLPALAVKSAFYAPFLDGQNPGHHSQQRCFSRSIRSNESQDRPFVEVKGQADDAGTCSLAQGLNSLGAGWRVGAGPTGRKAPAPPWPNPRETLASTLARGEPLWQACFDSSPVLTMWQGVLQSLAPLAGGGLALYLYHRRTNESEQDHWTGAIGANGVRMALAFAVLIWIVPAGALLALPALLLLSVISPAGRQEWSEQRTPRLMALSVAVRWNCKAGKCG